jgi:endogenous inhibitor of DNA gyrase (YacG/DUF329 family)
MSKSSLCAQCRKHPVEPAFRPFCSKRCADVDLGQWLKGGYVISGNAVDTEDDEAGLGGPDEAGGVSQDPDAQDDSPPRKPH